MTLAIEQKARMNMAMAIEQAGNDTRATHARQDKLRDADGLKPLETAFCAVDTPTAAMLRATEAFWRELQLGPSGPGRWLSLLGHSGCGKTMLAKSVYTSSIAHIDRPNYRLCSDAKRRYEELYLDARTLATWAYEGRRESIRDLYTVPFLVLDDLGAGYDPRGYLSSIIDELIDRRLGRWTMITSNLFLDAISEKIDERVASRMRRDQNVVLESSAPDYATR